jgi:hypothetical protein
VASEIQWKRDPVDVFAFHIDVPSARRTLDIEFQFASATAGDQGRIVMTPGDAAPAVQLDEPVSRRLFHPAASRCKPP